jgi:hypothetical protein
MARRAFETTRLLLRIGLLGWVSASCNSSSPENTCDQIGKCGGYVPAMVAACKSDLADTTCGAAYQVFLSCIFDHGVCSNFTSAATRVGRLHAKAHARASSP